MERPLKQERPFGPVFTSSGTCVLRFSTIFQAESKPEEVRQSLINSIETEALDVVSRVDNISLISNRLEDRSNAVDIEVRMDLPTNQITDEQEDQLVKGIGRALINGGVTNPDIENYSYSVVSR